MKGVNAAYVGLLSKKLGCGCALDVRARPGSPVKVGKGAEPTERKVSGDREAGNKAGSGRNDLKVGVSKRILRMVGGATAAVG